MIRPLRARHRRVVTVLAVLVPVVFVAGLLARQPVPAEDDLPRSVRPATPERWTAIEIDDVAWGDLALRTIWLAGPEPVAEGPRQRGVKLRFLEDPRIPDLLVYWAPTAEGRALSLEAHLLGAIGDRQERSWRLPPGAAGGGVLVLYSLARQEVVGTARVPAVRGGGP